MGGGDVKEQDLTPNEGEESGDQDPRGCSCCGLATAKGSSEAPQDPLNRCIVVQDAEE